jgi:hypothetical protein
VLRDCCGHEQGCEGGPDYGKEGSAHAWRRRGCLASLATRVHGYLQRIMYIQPGAARCQAGLLSSPRCRIIVNGQSSTDLCSSC